MNILCYDSTYFVRLTIIYIFDDEHEILLKILKPKALMSIKKFKYRYRLEKNFIKSIYDAVPFSSSLFKYFDIYGQK